MFAFHEVAGRDPAEIREIDTHDLIMVPVEDLAQAEAAFRPAGLLLEVPFALLPPPEADGAVGRHDLARSLVIGDGLPVGIVGLAQLAVEILRTQHPARH